MAAPLHRALFVGAFIAPALDAYGLSLGVTSSGERPEEAPSLSGEPLRLKLGHDREREAVSASLQGEFEASASGSEYLDGHVELGPQSWLDQELAATSGALRAWRQTRLGVSLGGAALPLQVSLVHDPISDLALVELLSGRQHEVTERLAMEWLVDHRSIIASRSAQRHVSRAQPGLLARLGAPSRVYGELYLGAAFSQQVLSEPDTLGIGAGDAVATLATAQAGAHFEGRFARTRHLLSPRLDLFGSPWRWQQDVLKGEAQASSRFGAMGTLDQAWIGRASGLRLAAPLTALWRTQRLEDQAGETFQCAGGALFLSGRWRRAARGAARRARRARRSR